jgi:(E)-4-hydroxy-3-methyl-but-2-enyl pyrophosphate reductase
MKILIAEKCGFCHGVRNAIRVAEKTLEQEKLVYSLGPIIHNKDVVERLAKSGLKTVSNIEAIEKGTALIRSHGAAPAQIAKLKEKGVHIVDATCILVKKVQHLASEFERDGYTVLIIGDENHPEVQAVKGCVREAIVVAGVDDLHKVPDNSRLGVICQTTQSPEHFGMMVGAIARRNFNEMKVINTLCMEAVRRQESAVRVCREVDIMFVLGGLESSNTHRLAELCKEVNNCTYHLQNWSELDHGLLAGKKTVGITAGASTPDWIIDDFVRNLETIKDI